MLLQTLTYQDRYWYFYSFMLLLKSSVYWKYSYTVGGSMPKNVDVLLPYIHINALLRTALVM